MAYGQLAQTLVPALRGWYTYRGRIGSMLNNIYASKVAGPTGFRGYFAMQKAVDVMAAVQASLANDSVVTADVLLSHMQFAIWVAEKNSEREMKLSLLPMRRPTPLQRAKAGVPEWPYDQLLPMPKRRKAAVDDAAAAASAAHTAARQHRTCQQRTMKRWERGGRKVAALVLEYGIGIMVMQPPVMHARYLLHMNNGDFAKLQVELHQSESFKKFASGVTAALEAAVMGTGDPDGQTLPILDLARFAANPTPELLIDLSINVYINHGHESTSSEEVD